MTQALYLSDITQAEVEILRCEPTDDGRFSIQLAQTPFHPQGGGQPSDLGKINGVDGFMSLCKMIKLFIILITRLL